MGPALSARRLDVGTSNGVHRSKQIGARTRRAKVESTLPMQMPLSLRSGSDPAILHRKLVGGQDSSHRYAERIGLGTR